MSDDKEYYRELASKIYSESALKGLSTGYTDLDTLSGGLKEGSLVVLAGTTGTGKSLLAMNILLNLARKGVHCDYMDLENSESVSHQRFVSIWTGEARSVFTNDVERAGQAMYEYSEFLHYFDHEFLKSTTESLTSRVIKFANASTSRVILIDPLQALEDETDGAKILNEQGKIVRTLKELAQKKGKTIILCHHMRKSQARGGDWVSDLEDVAEQKYQIPALEDLRGSGKITDFATDVWGLVRTSGSSNRVGRGKTLLRVLKNRTGLRGDVRMFFNEDNLQFHLRQGMASSPNEYLDFTGVLNGNN